MSRAAYRRFAEKLDEQKLIYEIIEETFNKLQEPLVNVTLNWSNKLKTTAGTASGGKIITLSNDLWERANTEQRKELVIHETCHLVVQQRRSKNDLGYSPYFGYYTGEEGYCSHGETWQNCMRTCGYENPKRCHTIKPNRRLFLYTCKGCNKEYKVNIRTHNKVLKNTVRLLCKNCGNVCISVEELK